MATLNYRDPVDQQWKTLDPPVGPAGATGTTGPTGPTAVSADPGNAATLNADGIYVAPVTTAETDLLYVQAAGDTMTGALLLPDQVATPPSAPAVAAAKGYVDQLITVSDVEPDPVADAPVRDGLIWNVVGDDVVVTPGTITLTYPAAANAGFTVSGAYTVNWGDGSAIESFAAGAPAEHDSPGSVVVEAQTGQNLTSFVLKPTSTSPTDIVFDAPTLTHIVLVSAVHRLTQVDFLAPVVLDSCARLFEYQDRLISVTGSIASNGTDFSSMFTECPSLTTIPNLDTSNGTNFSNMFGYCGVLVAIPDLDTSNGTNFSNMFEACSILTAIPDLDTSNGTNFSFIFIHCPSLTTVPDLDTSSGTDFAGMFYGCSALTVVPALDTSSGINFNGMFGACSTLTAIPNLDTSSGINFNGMFGACSTLTAIPDLDTSSGTDFSYMISGCNLLVAIPDLDTSNGTNFAGMFYECPALTVVPSLDASSGTNFSDMFELCPNVVQIDAHGFTYNVSVAGCPLDAVAINTFFTNLGTAVAGATVDITGNPGAATCDRSIATAKGWTVTG